MASPHNVPVLIGLIGGSGIYKLDCVENPKYYSIDTPYGLPSGDVCVATVRGVPCAFLPRHGPAHTFNPSEVNYRANIYAMKVLGVRYLITINAVGSLDENFRPGDLVLADQIIDKTYLRKNTFFEKGLVAHVDFAHPTSDLFRAVAHTAIQQAFPELASGNAGWKLHNGATLVTMEGPQFSTKAESLWNKSIGGQLIGMTSAPEAKLAREAEMAYLNVSMVTDMDAWTDEPHVKAGDVMEVMKANVEKAQRYPPLIIAAIAANPFKDPAHDALRAAVLKTGPIGDDGKRRLGLLLSKYPEFLE